MRLIEIRKRIENALTDNNQLIFQSESLFKGMAFRLSGGVALAQALDILRKQSWAAGVDSSVCLEVFGEESVERKSEYQITPDQQNRLSAIVSHMNAHLPMYMSILRTIAIDQPDNLLCVKLPEGTDFDIEKLTDFNKELQEVIKVLILHHGLGGEVKFKGFDVGTSWYELLVIGKEYVLPALLELVELALKLIELKDKWRKSEDIRRYARVEPKKGAQSGFLNKKDDATDIDTIIESRIKTMMDEELESKVKDIIERYKPHGFSPGAETFNSLSMGVQKLISMIEKGTEFHPSLTPPKYVSYSGGGFKIDYERLQELFNSMNQIKQIQPSPSETKSEES